MIRIALYLLGVLALTASLHWLAKRPGSITVEWLGYITEVSVFSAVIILAALLGAALLVWSLLRQIWHSPAALARLLNRRRQQRGLDALTGGIIAVGAGDRALAVRYAAQARRALPHEPLTHLLRAQAAEISGDRATARRIFEAMLASPDTEQLGLRGLFLEAEREGEREALKPLLDGRLTPRVCTLMARIEGEQYGDAGRVREWLARAVTAPRDPAWTADGVVSDRWSPISPATGELDAMRWRVPEGPVGGGSVAEALAARLEVLAGVAARSDARADAATPEAVVEPAPASVELPAANVPPTTVRREAPPQPAPPQPQARLEPPQAEDIAPADVPFRQDAARARPRKALETKIFVAPRAPDDPGTGASDIDDLQGYPTKA
jgi:uncharacterized membrane-anchored protein